MKKENIKNNIVFIDRQNLHLGTTSAGWKIDFVKFRKYLKDKYQVSEVFYFLGIYKDEEKDLYERIQRAGYILVFRNHNIEMLGKKKGNVDVDLVFNIMKKLYKNEILGKVLVVSGDGDYFEMVKFLIDEETFLKILFPQKKKSSSLYKKINIQYTVDLSKDGLRKKIEFKKEKAMPKHG